MADREKRRRGVFTLQDIPDGIRRLNPGLFGENGDVPGRVLTLRQEKADAGGKTERSMNKTEARFYEVLKREAMDGALIVPQPTRFFRFDNGDTYTPDFIVIDELGFHVYEVKGGYRGSGWEQGYDRYYRAREKFQSERNRVTFNLATWDTKRREWIVE